MNKEIPVEKTIKKSTAIKFGGYNCRIEWSHYSAGGRTALYLVDDTDGEPITTATVNIPEVPLEKNEILIKNWSENEGVLKALEDAGVIMDTGRKVKTGFVEANICRVINYI